MPRWEESAYCVQPKEKGLAHLFLRISSFHKHPSFEAVGGNGICLPAWLSPEGQLWRYRQECAEVTIQYV